MLIRFEVKIELPVIWLGSLFERFEQVLDAVRGERRLAKNTHNFKDGSSNLEVVLDDCNEAVCDDCNVNLYAHSILGFSPESFDLEMLLNPFEEQLHLPPVFIKESDVLGCKIEIVRVVNKAPLEFRGIVYNPSNDSGILLLIVLLGKAYALVFEDVLCPIKYAFSIDNLVGRLTLLPDDEESSEYVDTIEPGKVKIASIKHIARQRLVCEPVHRIDIMHLCCGDPVEYGDLCNDVNLSMDPDARLGASKLCPSEYRHAQVDGSGVDGIELSMQLKLLCNAPGLGNGYHVESELFKNTIISESVGLRQHLSVDRLVAKSEVFRLLGMGGCYICEFPKASAAHKLTEHQNQQMVPMRHRPTLGPVVVLGEYPPELPLREELYYLCKNECPYMHICSDFKSDAKISISKPGQGIVGLKRCA